MSLELCFSVASIAAMAGWLALLAAPFFPKVASFASQLLVPGLLCLAYTVLILVYWSGAEGDFNSLNGVMKLFTRPEIALAGWLHYLAFDLLIGGMVAQMARANGISVLLTLPCLLLTFLFGPLGLLVFTIIRIARNGGVSKLLEA